MSGYGLCASPSQVPWGLRLSLQSLLLFSVPWGTDTQVGLVNRLFSKFSPISLRHFSLGRRGDMEVFKSLLHSPFCQNGPYFNLAAFQLSFFQSLEQNHVQDNQRWTRSGERRCVSVPRIMAWGQKARERVSSWSLLLPPSLFFARPVCISQLILRKQIARFLLVFLFCGLIHTEAVPAYLSSLTYNTPAWIGLSRNRRKSEYLEENYPRLRVRSTESQPTYIDRCRRRRAWWALSHYEPPSQRRTARWFSINLLSWSNRKRNQLFV